MGTRAPGFNRLAGSMPLSRSRGSGSMPRAARPDSMPVTKPIATVARLRAGAGAEAVLAMADTGDTAFSADWRNLHEYGQTRAWPRGTRVSKINSSSLSDLRLICCAGERAVHICPIFRYVDQLRGLKTGQICPRSPTRLATIAQVRQAARSEEHTS